MIDEMEEELRRLESEAQRAAEARVNDLEDRFHAEMDGDDDAWDGFEGAAPYCGCTTCLVREVLFAAWPFLQQAGVIAQKLDEGVGE